MLSDEIFKFDFQLKQTSARKNAILQSAKDYTVKCIKKQGWSPSPKDGRHLFKSTIGVGNHPCCFTLIYIAMHVIITIITC